MRDLNFFTVDVEEWFHILDSPATPTFDSWSRLESRAEKSMFKILSLLAETDNKATFFWLGWMAERMPKLVIECANAGHEIASHGYAHVLAYEVGKEKFKDDIVRSKKIIENILGQAIKGFRAPGFGITENVPWAFDVIKEAGYEYDASIFPASRGHGGMQTSPIYPYLISTKYGYLPEIPVSAIEMFNRRLNFFGGGYLRITPYPLIQAGIRQLKKKNLPLIIYVHPRELDPTHPRLPLTPIRKFKCYVNLSSTKTKLKALLRSYKFHNMGRLVEILNIQDCWRMNMEP